MEAERIVLGSGKIYITEYEDAIPADSALEVDANLLGAVSGGASLEYTNEYYTAISDDGTAQKTIMTAEKAVLKGGVCTFNADTLAVLCATASEVTETTTKRTVKIGGLANQNGKNYVVRFLHEDPVDGDIRVTIVGQNTAGLTLAFAKDKETVLNPEFTAIPSDSNGTLVIYEETIPAAATNTSSDGES